MMDVKEVGMHVHLQSLLAKLVEADAKAEETQFVQDPADGEEEGENEQEEPEEAAPRIVSRCTMM